MAKKKVPKFQSLEEERRFWDETSLTEVEGIEEVEVERLARPKVAFAIRLDPETVKALRDAAHARGMHPTQLARQWVVERLDLEDDIGDLPGADMAGALERVIHRVVAESSARAAHEAVRGLFHYLQDPGGEAVLGRELEALQVEPTESEVEPVEPEAFHEALREVLRRKSRGGS
jgi:CopG antitoxin of type II toxin-antitoxin system